MRIGLLGGSFDPPHNGHLLAASDAFDALSLDRLVFIPTAVQPLKVGQASGTPDQRLAMTRALIGTDARFEASSIEIDRGGLSYTVDTLTSLAAQWPAAELFWLVGTDVLRSFMKWKEPARILELATLVVLHRADGGEGSSGFGMGVPPTAHQPRMLETRRIDISSTEIRERVRQGKSIRGFVPDAVAGYIEAERLYR